MISRDDRDRHSAEIEEGRQEAFDAKCRRRDFEQGIDPEEEEGGVEKCQYCGGLGFISYNPNLNPNAFPATATAKCGHCNGTGIQPEGEDDEY